MIRHLPRTSALARSVHGDDAEWGLTEHLLAALVDLGAVANWQRTSRPGHRPRPLPRPGVAAPDDQRRIGTAHLSIDEARARFDHPRR